MWFEVSCKKTLTVDLLHYHTQKNRYHLDQQGYTCENETPFLLQINASGLGCSNTITSGYILHGHLHGVKVNIAELSVSVGSGPLWPL